MDDIVSYMVTDCTCEVFYCTSIDSFYSHFGMLLVLGYAEESRGRSREKSDQVPTKAHGYD